MDKELLNLLKRVDTPTVSNAIEVAQGKRGYKNFTKGTMICSDTKIGSIVGYARTASIAAAEAPFNISILAISSGFMSDTFTTLPIINYK